MACGAKGQARLETKLRGPAIPVQAAPQSLPCFSRGAFGKIRVFDDGKGFQRHLLRIVLMPDYMTHLPKSDLLTCRFLVNIPGYSLMSM